MGRVLWFWSVALVLFGVPALAQEGPDTPPPADLVEAPRPDRSPLVPKKGELKLRVSPLGDGWVREGHWSAARVTLANGDGDQRVQLRVEEPDPMGEASLPFVRSVELPSGSVKEVDVYFRPGMLTSNRSIDVLPSRSSPTRVALNSRTLSQKDVLIGVIGEDPFGLQVVRETWSHPVPGVRPRLRADEARMVRMGQVPTDTLPERAAAWEAFDQVVWREADPSKVQPEQLRALLRWVAAGGNLLVTVTDKWQVVRNSALDEALPIELSGLTSARVEPLAGALTRYDQLPREADFTQLMPMAQSRLREQAGRATYALVDTDNGPQWAVGTYGLGTVSVLTMNPAVSPLSDAVSRDTLWRGVLFLPPPDHQGSALGSVGLSSEERDALGLAMRAYACGLAGACVYEEKDPNMMWGADEWTWAGRIRGVLSDVPGISPLPLPILIGFSLLYLVMIGPVDFFVLRAMQKQTWTWITFPVTIAVFTTIALVGTSLYKGNQAVVRRVEVVDVLPGTSTWRGQTFLGVFSTRKTDLTIDAGSEDALIWPMEGRGFMTSPLVQVSEGPGRLRYRAETWTLAYTESSWIGDGQGSVTYRDEGDAPELVLDLPFALDNVEIRYGTDVLARLGTLEPGTHSLGGSLFTGQPLTDASELTDVREYPERGRGLLVAGTNPVLYGVVRAPVQPIVIEGLAPESQTITLVRAPLRPPGNFDGLDAGARWIPTTLGLGGL